jgi:hypothetical protein
VTNLRVGVRVLQDCIQRAGSVQAGLKFYVGAGLMADDGGYADKVMAEHARLQQVAAGKNVPLPPPATIRAVAPVPPAAVPQPVGETPITLS